MTARPIAFFTIDHGTATTAAAIIGQLDGRFRLLAAGAQPAGISADGLLAGLVAEVAAIEPDVLPDPTTWSDWRRLESATHRPPRALVAAASETGLGAAEAAVAAAGWRVVGRISPERTDALAATERCLDPDVELLVVATADPVPAEERDALADLVALVAAALGRRDDEPTLVLAGGAAGVMQRFPAARVVLGPAPLPHPHAGADPLRDLLVVLDQALTAGAGGPAAGFPDGRRALVTATASLAAVLDRRVELVDVGATAGLRVLVGPGGVRGAIVSAEGALTPPDVIEDDRRADGVLQWSTIRADAASMRDRVRNLAIAPWRDAAGDGARLRLAAARAALARLDAAWRLPDDAEDRPASYGTDLLVASGGAFAVAPAPAVALALVDTLRRPGGMTLAHDHARVLAPIGGLADEADRRRLLADLLGDVLAPLGSAIVAAGLHAGRHRGTVRITSEDGADMRIELVPGGVQLVDLPPGVAATAELTTRDGLWLGVRAHHFALPVAGGLGGLVVDTREIPLRLPERPERRRDLLDAWQRPLWAGADT